MNAVKTDDLGKSFTHLLKALADILSAGGPPFSPALEELKKLLVSPKPLEPEPVKKTAFNLANVLGEVSQRVASGVVEVRSDTGPAAETGAAALKTPEAADSAPALLLAIIGHLVSIRQDQYREQVKALTAKVEAKAPMEEVLQGLLDLIILIREDLWEERSKAFKHIGDILKSLEATEKDLISTICASQTHLTDSDQQFTTAMEDGLLEIGSLVAPGQNDLDKLCQQIAHKLGHLHNCVQHKKKADQARLETLAAERQGAEQRLVRSQRDYEEFSRQSHEMLQEIETLRAVSLRDPLTEIYNRRAYDSQILKTISAVSAKDLRTCGLIVFDIDHFRNFNNKYGHLAGDRILSYVARLTREALRSDDLIFRSCGDEFVILTPNAGLEAARGVAEKVRRSITSVEFKLFKNSDLTVKVTVSMGVAEIKPGDDASSFFARADRAMYRAKTAGRNRVSFSA